MTDYKSKSYNSLDLLPSIGEDSINTKPALKVFKRRWIILFMYVSYAMVNSFQSLQYAIISNIITRYYGISAIQVDFMSIIYMVLYLPLVIPASYLMDRLGLRVTALIGCIGTCIGTAIKIFAMKPEHVWAIYVGQTVLSCMTVLIQPLPPRLAAVWFGPEQVSLASGIGIFGTYLGQVAGLLITPYLVKNHENLETIGEELASVSYSLTGLIAIITIAVIIYFPAQPPKPPSINQALERFNRMSNNSKRFFSSLKRLIFDPAFMCHSVAYGITVGVCMAVTALFAQMLLEHFPDVEGDIVQIMMSVSISGLLSIILFSYLLDKTRKYIETAAALSFFVAIFLMGYTYALECKSIVLVYVCLSALGFALNGYIPSAYELAVELTYPEPESSSAGLLISVSQAGAALLTLLLGFMVQNFGSLWGLCSMTILSLICAIVTTALPNRLRRQNYVHVDQVDIKSIS